MSTDSSDTSIAHLFAPDNEAPSVEPASPQPSDQPAPPDVQSYDQQPVSETQAQPTPDQQPAPGQEQPSDQQEQQQSHQVPLSELIKERQRRQSAETVERTQQQRIDQLEQMVARLSQPQQPQPQYQQQQQPQQAEPDYYDDPEALAQTLEQRIEHRFLNMALNDSERRAVSEHGQETVDAALDAAKRAGFAQAFINKPDAYGDMVRWHKAQLLQDTIGTDPDAYETQMKERIRQQVIAEMRQGTPPPSNITPPLSSATRANPQMDGAIGSDKDFFNEAMNRKRG